MRLGIDCDGVLCNFSKRYAEYAKKLCMLNLDISQQREWSFQSIGVSPAQDDLIWQEIKNTPNFWRWLEPLPGAWSLFWAQHKYELFFITSRVPTVGRSVAHQTAEWLKIHHDILYPTVLVADLPSQKIPLALNLGIDAFVDDKPSTIKSMRNAGLSAYIFDQPYNGEVEDPRVKSVDEFLSRLVEGVPPDSVHGIAHPVPQLQSSLADSSIHSTSQSHF